MGGGYRKAMAHATVRSDSSPSVQKHPFISINPEILLPGVTTNTLQHVNTSRYKNVCCVAIRAPNTTHS